jgi:hypothetical protein
MPWIIDRDYLAEPGSRQGTLMNAVGLKGPRSYTGDGRELDKRFRILDDDGEIYYEGRSNSDDDENALAPLDDFATPNAGATAIKYWTTSPNGRTQWRSLNIL